MTTKTKPTKAAAKSEPKTHNATIKVYTDPKTSLAAAMAKTLVRPEVNAATVIERWQKDTHDVNEVMAELSEQVKQVNDGDMRRVEAMLVSQAYVLDGVFGQLMRRAVGDMNLALWEAYMRAALRAQSQCRMTLEALAAIKNPPVVYAKQANINNGGQQQVNNGTGTPGISPSPNELSGAASELLTDARASQSPIGAHPVLETVGAVHRATDA